MKIAILAIGNELLNGQTLNTNLQVLGEELSSIGHKVDYAITINDHKKQILNSLNFIYPLVDFIITIGGLGPTHDDFTRDVIAEFTKKKLILNNIKFNEIIKKGLNRNYTIKKENALRESLLIEGACFIPNHVGYADGLKLEYNDKVFYLLPGPPREFIPMVKKELLPNLMQASHYQRVIYTCGLSEPEIKELVTPYLKLNLNFAICAKLGEVRITLFGKDKKLIKTIYNKLTQQLTHYVLTKPSLEETIITILKNKCWTVSTAESCTGGLISSRLTNITGSSQVYQGSFITYANKWKENYLQVDNYLFQKFGAVSKQVAEAMAHGLQTKEVHCGLAVTGIAGPKTEQNKPIGLTYIASFIPNSLIIKEYQFIGNRERIRQQACIYGLNQLRIQLISN